MPKVRFNHLELTFARGTLDKQLRTDIDAFWCGVFGWESIEVDLLGQTCHLLRPDDGQFILLAEADKPIQSPGFDHIGLLCDTRGEVDDLLGQIHRYQRSLGSPRLLREVPPSDLLRRPVHGVERRRSASAALAVPVAGKTGRSNISGSAGVQETLSAP
jgi:hypothetical protein